MTEEAKDPSLRELGARLQALKEIIDERDRRYEDRFRAMDEKTSLALSSSEKAVQKAETATEKRFDSVNEFRGSLKDQAATLIPREEANAKFSSLEEKINQLREFSSGIGGKEKAGERNLALLFSVVAILIGVAALVMRAFGK
jgi:hypothetical protein